MSEPRDERRHRPSEAHAPRPSDLLADRLRPIAAWMRARGVSLAMKTEDGADQTLDADAVDALVSAQQLAEIELQARFHAFRSYYAEYTEVVRARERVVHAAIAAFDRKDDPDARRAMRLSRLRRPPLAKVLALEARAGRQNAITPTSYSACVQTAVANPRAR